MIREDKIIKDLVKYLAAKLSEKEKTEKEHGIHRVSPSVHFQLHKNDVRDIIELLSISK